MAKKVLSRASVVDAAKKGRKLGNGVLRKSFVCDEIKQLAPNEPTNRQRQFVISTGAVDRDNDTIDPNGWHLENFRRCPTVLFAHDYSSLPIGRATDVHVQDGKLIATAEFADHPMAETCLKLIDGGFLRATSVGFRPMKASPSDTRDGLDFQEQELLEFSVVPVPANPEALIMAHASGIDMAPLKAWAFGIVKGIAPRKQISPTAVALLTALDDHVDAADELLDTILATLGIPDDDDDYANSDPANGPADGGGPAVGIKGISPSNISTVKAPVGEAWSAPSLSDLTDKSWGDLTDAEKRNIAGHFAWADASVPSAFGDCKLPHHNAKGEVVWRGVVAATGRLNQASIPSADLGAVKAHLRKHYAQFQQPAPDALKSGDPDIGETLTEPAHVPAPGTASETTPLCPACGAIYDGNVCAACGWQSPTSDPASGDDDPMIAPVRSMAAMLIKSAAHGRLLSAGSLVSITRRLDLPQQITGSTIVANGGDDDPLRWNRHLSKAFDVASEPTDPSRTELAWVSRYLDVPVQQISAESFVVPSARMGSYLSAFDEGISAWHVDALRNLNYGGKEEPPQYESIQLNSVKTRSFLIEGSRFMRRTADGVKMVVRMDPCWSGLNVTEYVRADQAPLRAEFNNMVAARATQLNYLKGEAFTLSGEFLHRGDLNFSDLFLEASKEVVLRRTVDRVNEDGEHMVSRGLLLLGPPGTGKTLTGRVMMRQADATFIWISARDFYRSGAFGAFTYAFDLAAECAPTILFFEDVDNWLGKDTIDLLKTEMDGIKRRDGITTVLTTNFPELLPDALIDRPGRFHDLVDMSLPVEAVRARMLKAWVPELSETSVERTAKATDGFSGAHLRELVSFAKTIMREEKALVDDALVRALAKIREQRDLVESLRQAPDYRPRRQVRAVVGEALALVAKRGRVLSSANETLLRTAHEHISTVLGKLDRQPTADDEDTVNAGIALQLVDEVADGVVLSIVGEDDAVASPEDIRAALRQAITDALGNVGSLVREETAAALARARGRVD